MALSRATRRNLALGALAFLVVTALFVRAGDAVETQLDKKEASQEPDTDVGPGVEDNLAVSKEVNEIDQLLAQSLATNEALDKENAKVKAWKIATYGSLASAGLGGLLGLGKALYGVKNTTTPTKKGTALNFLLAGLVLAGAAGAAAGLVKKAQAEKKLKAQARELLGQRQAMLSKLSQLKDSQLEKVLNKAEEIGNIAGDLGLYAPAIEAAVNDMEGVEDKRS